MAAQNSGMKNPTRPAPSLPPVNRSKLVMQTSENFMSDPFSPFKAHSAQQDKKKPPPRPPPPKLNSTQVPNLRRSAFGSSKKKLQKPAATAIVKPLPPASNIPVGTLIDLQSPPSSPQFPTKLRSSLSVGNISNYTNSASLIESGFEDDFNSILSSTATTPAFDPWSTNSDFTPSSSKTPSPDLILPPPPPPVTKNESKSRNFKQTIKYQAVSSGGPTIICVPSSNKPKPIRPPPPSNSSLCNIQSVNKLPFCKEGSPPMPSIPPPPPPPEASNILSSCPAVPPRPTDAKVTTSEKQPYCVALYDYESAHPDDLNFKEGEVISIVSEVNEEWLRGRYSNKEGMFPRNYVKVMLSPSEVSKGIMTVIAIYPFNAETWDDLDMKEGDKIKVLSRINKDWLYGECEGRKGQFPECFTQDITDLEVD